tara:strand:+ start:4333 stop:4443 length:111 start_codon:yes stop_codon:yes gene_type:complete
MIAIITIAIIYVLLDLIVEFFFRINAITAVRMYILI